jgi:hypothetical protein
LGEFVRRSASEVFEIPYHAPIGERVYEPTRKPYFAEYGQELLLFHISPVFIEHIMSGKMREKRVKERLKKQIDKPVLRNPENLRREIFQNIDTTFRKLSAGLDNNLSRIIKATHGTINSSLAER